MMQGQRELSRLYKLRARIRQEIGRIDSNILRLERGLDLQDNGRPHNGALGQARKGSRHGRRSLSAT